MYKSAIRSSCAGLAMLAMGIFFPHVGQATEFCNIKATSDGFVALRDGPSSKAKLLGRMTHQDEVMIGLGSKGKWMEVTWWRGMDRLEKGYDHKAGHGWVNSKFIEEECG